STGQLTPSQAGAPVQLPAPPPAPQRLAAAPAAPPAAPGLMGLAQASLPPDIASGARTNLSYTQGGNTATPFHYDSTPPSPLLADGRRFTLANPTGGTRKTVLDTRLNNNGAFAGGGTATDFSVTGKVTIDGTTFDGALVTGQVRGFGSRVGSGS